MPPHLMVYRKPPVPHSPALDNSLRLLLRHRIRPNHATWCLPFREVFTLSSRCSAEGELMLRSNNPLFRFTEIKATPSGTLQIGSGIGTATTVSSSPRRSVITDEQCSQSQKYSPRLEVDALCSESHSRRNSLPSCRYRKGVEQVGLLHLESIPHLDHSSAASALMRAPSSASGLPAARR